MVRFHIKKGDESQFLYEVAIDTPMSKVYEEITTIYNMRIKISNLCYGKI